MEQFKKAAKTSQRFLEKDLNSVISSLQESASDSAKEIAKTTIMAIKRKVGFTRMTNSCWNRKVKKKFIVHEQKLD